MKKFFLEVARGLMFALPLLAVYSFYRDVSDKVGWLLLLAEGILIATVIIPWSSLSFGNRQRVAHNYAAPVQPAAPLQAQQGPGFFHNLGTAMKPIAFGIAGTVFLLIACVFAFKAWHADEPLAFVLIAAAAFTASVICFLVQAGELKAFASNSTAWAWTWTVLSLFAAACFYMYARQEGNKWFESGGFWISVVSVFLAFLATQEKLGDFLASIGTMIMKAYTFQFGAWLGVMVWVGSAVFLGMLALPMGKLDIFDGNEGIARIADIASLVFIAIAMMGFVFGVVWALFKKK